MQAARSAPASLPGRGETVLVAEDDSGVRALVKSVLERNGCRVLAAADGQAGLDLAHQEKARIDLLLSDVIMPRMNGRDLRDVLSVLYPGLRVIFISRYTGNLLTGLADLDGDVQLVPSHLPQTSFCRACARRSAGSLRGLRKASLLGQILMISRGADAGVRERVEEE